MRYTGSGRWNIKPITPPVRKPCLVTHCQMSTEHWRVWKVTFIVIVQTRQADVSCSREWDVAHPPCAQKTCSASRAIEFPCYFLVGIVSVWTSCQTYLAPVVHTYVRMYVCPQGILQGIVVDGPNPDLDEHCVSSWFYTYASKENYGHLRKQELACHRFSKMCEVKHAVSFPYIMRFHYHIPREGISYLHAIGDCREPVRTVSCREPYLFVRVRPCYEWRAVFVRVNRPHVR